MHHVRYTLFHPQYLAYRFEHRRYKLVANEAAGKILDIGCGRQPLRKYIKTSCDYYSLDYPMTGKKLYAARPDVFGDAHKLPFANGSFDTIVMLEVLEHLTDPYFALQEARRIVSPGGCIIISTPFLYPIHDAPGDYTRWTYHGLQHLTRKSGLAIRRSVVFGNAIESSVLLFNLSLAWQMLHVSPLALLPLAVLTFIVVPLFNLLAIIGSQSPESSSSTPFAVGYLLVLD
ncbi:MAG: class I SAM-dependent methyltransferase [Gammaproteobacteria bacterium]|nr:class I SAM-dependent methyltransferase [Gammaproteobacteria bacterium]